MSYHAEGVRVVELGDDRFSVDGVVMTRGELDEFVKGKDGFEIRDVAGAVIGVAFHPVTGDDDE